MTKNSKVSRWRMHLRHPQLGPSPPGCGLCQAAWSVLCEHQSPSWSCLRARHGNEGPLLHQERPPQILRTRSLPRVCGTAPSGPRMESSPLTLLVPCLLLEFCGVPLPSGCVTSAPGVWDSIGNNRVIIAGYIRNRSDGAQQLLQKPMVSYRSLFRLSVARRHKQPSRQRRTRSERRAHQTL